jgi:hypothetical protein
VRVFSEGSLFVAGVPCVVGDFAWRVTTRSMSRTATSRCSEDLAVFWALPALILAAGITAALLIPSKG